MDRRDVYMNHLQQVIYYSNARDVRVLGARRFGKTDGVIGPRIYKAAYSMPRMTGIWLGNSRAQLYKRTVPGTIAAIERFFGLREGVHFGWGRPPRWVPDPIIKPKTYDNVIWFANGSIYQLISLAVTGSANSITSNTIVADEVRFMPRKKIQEEVMPTLSGIVHPLGDLSFSEANPLYKSTLFCSDASLTNKNDWLEKEETKLQDKVETGDLQGVPYRSIQEELVAYAERVIYFNELLRAAKLNRRQIMEVSAEDKERIQTLVSSHLLHCPIRECLPTKSQVRQWVQQRMVSLSDADMVYNAPYLITIDEHYELAMLSRSAKHKRHIEQLQCAAFTFFRASTLDNIDIVGSDYIRRMQRDLPRLVFDISILNKKVSRSGTGFYFNLDIEKIHGYDPDDCPAIDKSMTLKTASTVHGGRKVEETYETPDFGKLGSLDDCTGDGDLMPNLPLYIAADYNAKINWFVTGQRYTRNGLDCLFYLSSRFVKYKLLQDLCAEWCHYYAPHQSTCRDVVFFYDATAKQRQYANNSKFEDFKDTIIRELSRRGWSVRAVDMGVPMEHKLKHKEINEALSGLTAPAIRINRSNNEAMILGLEAAEVKVGRNGFEKQKGGEKLAETEDDILEIRTDGTDAFDSLYIGVRHYLYTRAGMTLPSGSRPR